jgi:hypothetical protein
MSNKRTRNYPRSLDVLCGDAWELGYAAGQDDTLHNMDPEKRVNPYYVNYIEEE